MRHALSAATIAAVLAGIAGCDSTDYTIHPLLVTDTVFVAVPSPQNAGLPTALDIASEGAFVIGGGRYPERARDALNWDFAVRAGQGTVNLVPARALGIELRSAITPPIVGVSFPDLREAPGQASFVGDSAISMQVGNVHVARSRDLGGSGCVQFAKLQPLEVDTQAGTVRLQVTTNERCGDPRLVPID